MKGRLEAQKHRQVWRRYEKLQPKIHVTNKSQRQSTLYFEKFGIGVSVLLSGHLSNKLSSTALSPIPRLNFSEIIHLVYAVKGVLHAFDGHMFARPQYLTGELWRFLPWRIVGISLMIWYKYIDIYKLYMFLKLFSPSVWFCKQVLLRLLSFRSTRIPAAYTHLSCPSFRNTRTFHKKRWQNLRKCITIPYTLQHEPPSGPSVSSGVSMRYLYYKYLIPSINKWCVYETNCTNHILA